LSYIFSTHLYVDSLDKNNAGIAEITNGTINNKIINIAVMFAKNIKNEAINFLSPVIITIL